MPVVRVAGEIPPATPLGGVAGFACARQLGPGMPVAAVLYQFSGAGCVWVVRCRCAAHTLKGERTPSNRWGAFRKNRILAAHAPKGERTLLN